MRSSPDKKFLVTIELSGKRHYWLKIGCGNTDNINSAFRFSEETAKELCEKEPLLKMIPAPL